MNDGATPSVQIVRVGDRALLVVPQADDQLDAMVERLRHSPLHGMQDFLPAAATLLVTLETEADAQGVERELRRLLQAPSTATRRTAVTADELTVPVRYDGADLDEVARLLEVSVDEVIARHSSAVWRCRFVGFTAGFGYLHAVDAGLTVPRRSQSRTAVPPGSVALADGYSAVYPRQAPGGWQLIGSTELAMWSLDRPRPALLAPGTLVRFVAAGR